VSLAEVERQEFQHNAGVPPAGSVPVVLHTMPALQIPNLLVQPHAKTMVVRIVHSLHSRFLGRRCLEDEEKRTFCPIGTGHHHSCRSFLFFSATFHPNVVSTTRVDRAFREHLKQHSSLIRVVDVRDTVVCDGFPNRFCKR
jgi:hypothetical protein